MQSWGHSSRFERRNTALHPTRSAVLGIIAAAMGIDKYHSREGKELSRFRALRVTSFSIPRRDRRARYIVMQRLEDYHTVTGIRRASGKVDRDATVQTYRHYLLDARFGILIEGPITLIEAIAAALTNPKWGVWLGRKCCPPASPLLTAPPGDRATVWAALLKRAGYTGAETEEHFDRVLEVDATEAGADMIEDTPIAFGGPIGERHGPRWVLRVPRASM